MNWTIIIISKTLMTKISNISWRDYNKGGYDKGFTVRDSSKIYNFIDSKWEDKVYFMTKTIIRQKMMFDCLLIY